MDALRDTADLGELVQYIVIKLGDERYGIPIKYIDNIVKMQQVTRIPKAEEYLKGVLNIRGEIVPVMSLRLRMEMETDEITDQTCIIILRPDNVELFGIIIDAVDRVLTLGAKQIEKVSPSQNSTRKDAGFVSGVGKYEDGLVSILDLDALSLEKAENERKDKKE
ncbi:MAG: purine-binding chemotaxis protein CheW [Lachnospiraceae bacterium]|nr:purine-binding chemotaxis protein CheW [Lachnospiraceae bacterium]